MPATGHTDLTDRYVALYGRYCWPVAGLADLRDAPFLVAIGAAVAGRGRTIP